MRENTDLMQAIEEIAVEAGQEIMAVYRQSGDIEVTRKADDSPVTAADTRANAFICRALATLTPQVPVVSEEAALLPYSQRRLWREYWLVDPLDGTREFVSRNGEFTVNIALVRDAVPVLGVIHAPVSETSWAGVVGLGAWKQEGDGGFVPIRTRTLEGDLSREQLIVMASRRHGAGPLRAVLDGLAPRFGRMSLMNLGSSLKFCAIAEGRADLYVRFGPTCEWDTAAAQAILGAAGGQVMDRDYRVLAYNGKESIINPSFLAVGDVRLDWRQLLGRLDP
ncbi:MAG: 3'(2'),5'-bisphosphate nucleotidase CysQ [Pseudomonadales bacterium]|nr:3'(2'),5'-bisphosphate nucleotidase CysQ [Pseudomonadales bacterium]